MPDDNSSQAQQWMATGRERNLKMYRKYLIIWMNSNVYYVYFI